MNKTDFKINFWGTQGSTAVNNGRKKRYGSNTPCVSAECGENVFVFDMGTGLLPFSDYFLKQQSRPKTIDIFLSHYHLDHIEGLPFAGLAHAPDVSIRFHCPPVKGMQSEKIFSHIFSPPYFPTRLIEEAPPGRFVFNIFEPGQALRFGNGVIEMESFAVSHPGGALSYKLTYKNKSFCYLSDFEYGEGLSLELKAYLHRCDLAVIDAYFSNENLIAGWGHSSWEQCVEIWRQAEMKKMAIYHHNISYADAELDAIGLKLSAISENLLVAKDNMEIYI